MNAFSYGSASFLPNLRPRQFFSHKFYIVQKYHAVMKAFILIALKEGDARELLEELKTFPQVKNVYILFGEWDLIVEVELSGAEELGMFVMDKVRTRTDVKLTSSLIVAGK